MLLDRVNKVDSANHSLADVFEGSVAPGAMYYDNEPIVETLLWLGKELAALIDHQQVERRFEKKMDTKQDILPF